ncbi:MAG: hypothetical protein ACFFCW_34190, partial [Candidatus Hodarchaeota archaeon]
MILNRGNLTKRKGIVTGLPRSDWRLRLLVNARLRVGSIRGFRRRWFVDLGDTHSHPNIYHIQVINKRLLDLRADLDQDVRRLARMTLPGSRTLMEGLVNKRQNLDRRLVSVQHLWDFFFDMFSQRKTIYEPFLRRCDGIVGECYRLIFNRLGEHYPWIKTPPLCYMEKAYSPATVRRGVRFFQRAGLMTANPFPVIRIPYDRISTPWQLAVLVHEVSHNIHGDIPDLWQRTRIRIYKVLRKGGIPKELARTWSFWHKETLADLLSILFGGPAVVYSLLGLMSRPRRIVMR